MKININMEALSYAMNLNKIESIKDLIEKVNKNYNFIKTPTQFQNIISNKSKTSPKISFFYPLSKTLNVSIDFLLGRSKTIYPIDYSLLEFFSLDSINKMLHNPEIGKTLNIVFESKQFNKIAEELFKFFRFFCYPINTELDSLNDYINTYQTESLNENNSPFISWHYYTERMVEHEKQFNTIDQYLKNHLSQEDLEFSIGLNASKFLNKVKNIKEIQKNTNQFIQLSRSEKFDNALYDYYEEKPLRKDIATKCNITAQTLSKILSHEDDFSFSIEVILKICSHLQISIDYFLGTVNANEDLTYKDLGLSDQAFTNLKNFKHKTILIDAFRPIIESNQLAIFLEYLERIVVFNQKKLSFPNYYELHESLTFSYREGYNFICENIKNGDDDWFELLQEQNTQSNPVFLYKMYFLLKSIKDEDECIQSQLLNRFKEKTRDLLDSNMHIKSFSEKLKSHIAYLKQLNPDIYNSSECIEYLKLENVTFEDEPEHKNISDLIHFYEEEQKSLEAQFTSKEYELTLEAYDKYCDEDSKPFSYIYPYDYLELFYNFDYTDDYGYKENNFRIVRLRFNTDQDAEDYVHFEIRDEYGRTNLERVNLGLPALDQFGNTMELHHIDQEDEDMLALLTKKQSETDSFLPYRETCHEERVDLFNLKSTFWESYPIKIKERS